MITIKELNEIKNLRYTNLYYEEKEYFQYIFLNAISKYSKEFVFKGGTCLRICFGLERSSEDLDFGTKLTTKEVKKIVYKCLENFKLLNIPYENPIEKKFGNNIRFEIKFNGVLYNGNSNSTNTLKIDFHHQILENSQAKVVKKLFSDIPLFVISVLSEKEILAEKIRALINRREPKDLYDLWILFNKGVEIDRKLIKKKLKEEKSNFKNLRYPSEKEYKIVLKNLVKFLPDYKQVFEEVSENLKKIENVVV